MGTELFKSATFLLFARPSFAQGFGTLIDIGSTLVEYNYSQTEREADLKALAMDWAAVGIDISESISSVGAEISDSQPEASLR